jgi:acyl-CoA reductase-like NAD-dependent aldehyde dehydrogenase
VSSFVTRNPATGEVLEHFEYMTAGEVDDKLDAAAAAYRSWGRAALDERAALVRKVATRMRDERDALATLAVREMGKPIAQARSEVDKCAFALDYFAEHAAALLSPRNAPTNAAASYVAFRPLGAVLAIMPWNFPYWQVIRAAAPALMAGNVVLLKHAENTTRCALEIERVFREAGAADGIFGTLVMTNEDVDALIDDARIAAVTLTGSERAGIAVASAAGRALKKTVLELGGSDPFIVLADADLEKAVEIAVGSRFQNAGQSCIAAKRFIIVEAVYDDFLQRFTQRTKSQRVGDPLDERTQLGPCARADLRETLNEQVRATVEAGGIVVTGGKPMDGAGYFYEPTIVANVQPGMRMFDEEVFGPAASVVRASDVEAAITLANASSYGLGSTLFTSDDKLAQELAARIEAGSVFINGMVASDPRLPFGGVKKSGYGRELSAFGIHEFTNIQTVWVGTTSA